MATVDLRRAYSLIQTAFSEEGYKKGAFQLKFHADTQFKVESMGETVRIGFAGDLPTVSFKKIIRVSASVLGLYLDSTGGTLELKNFPDLPFDYEG